MKGRQVRQGHRLPEEDGTWVLAPTWDTTVTLLAGVAEAAAGVLLTGADGTPAGLAKGIPPVVITVWVF